MSKNGFANKPALVTELSRLLTADGAVTDTTYVPADAPAGAHTAVINANTWNTGVTKNNGYILWVDSAYTFIGACFSFPKFDAYGSIPGGDGGVLTIVASCQENGEIDASFNSFSERYVVDSSVTGVVPDEDGYDPDPEYSYSTNGTFVSTDDAGLITPPGAHTVQDLINAFLNNPASTNPKTEPSKQASLTSRKLYSFILANTVHFYNIDDFYKNGKGRILLTVDDGSVFLDSNKFQQAAATLPEPDTLKVRDSGANTWMNFNNKIKIVLSGTTVPSGSNTVTLAGSPLAPATATVTLGTAGGNNINENHNTRPEMLLALLSSTGTGFAQRYSTSTQNQVLYYAVRLGTTPEANVGTLRISAPTTL
jgi:hypothetical protein